MLKSKVEGEPAEFAELRRSLVELCEVSRARKQKEQKMDKTKESVSISIDSATWHRWKVLCVEQRRKIGEYLAEVINAEIAKVREEKKHGDTQEG